MQRNNHKVLIIGAQWPEPDASAAGKRMMQIIKALESYNYFITFACVAEIPHKHVLPASVKIEKVKLNNSSFDDFLLKLTPVVVIFDRYYTEEQFGWRVENICPNAMRILDTEDLHFLRYAREQQLLKKEKLNLYNKIAVREIASMYRCDLSLIISQEENKILKEHFNFPEAQLFYLPFMVNEITNEMIQLLPGYSQRLGFMFIGNFKHNPNIDAVNHLVKVLFPQIRKKIRDAELYVYGAYCHDKIYSLNNPDKGIYVKGWIADADKAMQTARVLLAPLRFGAGQKGKLLEAMQNGTPNVTYEVGAEGMFSDKHWGGFVVSSEDDFIEAAVKLYNDKDVWLEAQEKGFINVNQYFSYKDHTTRFNEVLNIIFKSLKSHRDKNFIGKMLTYHRVQSTKYLAKWIEEKNKNQSE